MPQSDKPSRGKGLTRTTLIRAALEIVDREGLDALSMRKLGAGLGVDPMAAYRHFPNKEALLDGVVEAVVTEVDLEVDTSLPWREQLRQLVDSDLRAMIAHPNVLPLLARRPLTTPESLKLVERALAIMTAAGIPRHEALLGVNVMGFLITYQAIAMSASAEDPRSPEDLLALFSELPRESFPNIIGAVEAGEFIESYSQLLDFWAGALFDRLEKAIRIAP